MGYCAEGYNLAQLMKTFGVADDVGDGDDGGSGRDHNEFSTFVREIYLNCKNLGIPRP